jgi:hypothetical protein
LNLKLVKDALRQQQQTHKQMQSMSDKQPLSEVLSMSERERLEGGSTPDPSGSTPDPTQDVGFTEINDARYADTADLTNIAPPPLPPTKQSRATTTSDEPPAKKRRGRPPKSAEEKKADAITKAKAKYKAC